MPRVNGISVERRFWLKVYPRGDCWEWRGARDALGYGYFGIGLETVAAHRFAYVEAKGFIPVGLTLDHLCRHSWCVRPSHLEAVPHRVNMLRGDTIGARNAKKTHCVHGHVLTPENIARNRPGRICRTCLLERKRQWGKRRRSRARTK